MRTKLFIAFALVGLVLAARPMLAHHSFAAQFDASKTFKYTGTVTKVEWQNPHTYFYIDVVDEATKQKANWAMEMGSPNVLMRSGRPVTGNFLNTDGSNTGNARTVILTATGQRLFAGSSQGVTP